MSNLPTGTVTFLFTDIEGSTQLLHELGRDYRAANDRHAGIMREAILAEGGREIRTEGDSFFVVFPTPLAAVRAVVAAQRGLQQVDWPEGHPIRVRMGIHTGEGVLGGDDYLGIDVNLAARISAAAHGGQILISEATRGLVADRLPEAVRIRSLGLYHLKGFPGAERLHQVEISGLPTGFPPLSALDVTLAHLPPEATTFIGRTRELGAVTDLLAARRLVTLTGPGGAGKTRLAIRAAAELAGSYPDGAYFVAAASIRDSVALADAIASELGVADEASAPAPPRIVEWARARRILLVLDNLEQIEAAGRLVDELLAGAVGLTVLATSRSPLHVPGEQEFPVPPLGVPDADSDAATLASSEAVELFLDRVRLIRPDFAPSAEDLAEIAGIVARLDGLPLAIELAAAGTRLLTVSSIRARLARRLAAVAGTSEMVPPRQRSLREAITWSYQLLAPSAQALFERVAVFAGGWNLEAADEVCGGESIGDLEAGLATLAEQSLIQAGSAGGEPRFWMLETIREFALERLLANGQTPELARRHGAWFHRLALEALAHAGLPDQERWLDRLEIELPNLRAAIAARDTDSERDGALALAAALRPFWLQRNHSAEGLRTLVDLTARATSTSAPGFAAATYAAAFIATWLGDYATARPLAGASVTAHRALGDAHGLADAIGTFAFDTIEIDPEAALSLFDEAEEKYRALGDLAGEGQTHLGRATAQFALGRLADCRASLVRSLEILQRAGDRYFALFTTIFLGRIELSMGNLEAGIGHYRSVLEASRRLDLRLGMAVALDYFGEVAIWSGDPARAVRLGSLAQRLKAELGGGIPPRIGGALDPVEAGRAVLEPDEFGRNVEAGGSMDVDSAIAEALAITPVSRPADD